MLDPGKPLFLSGRNQFIINDKCCSAVMEYPDIPGILAMYFQSGW